GPQLNDCGDEICSLHAAIRFYRFGSRGNRVLLGTSRETSLTTSQCQGSNRTSRTKVMEYISEDCL
ncbi:hypothetical protein PCANC_22901, partial [Puccinia coronata f. sp. avenae]